MADSISKISGGILGFYCAHSYIHSYEGPWSVNSTLKGVDKALYETFCHLKLKPEIRVILDPDLICYDYSDGPLNEDPDDEGGDQATEPDASTNGPEPGTTTSSVNNVILDTPGGPSRDTVQDEDIVNKHETLVVYGRPKPPVLDIADDAADDEAVRRAFPMPRAVSALTDSRSSTS